MNGRYKFGHKEIWARLDYLKTAPWLTSTSWWPDFLFHFTDIKNVVSILNSGFLFSRHQLALRDKNWEDAASPKVIGRTKLDITDYVRLYFRPLTPTAYANEGIRPSNRIRLDAHCPIPIYFLFDSRMILSLEETRFSNGNLARQGARLFDSSTEFLNLQFQDIYHNIPFSREDRDRIVNARHAEVVFPQCLSLYYLKYICCRSQAEYDTLRTMLSPTVWNKWRDRVRFRNPHTLFHRRWLHVESSTLTRKLITIDFHRPVETADYGPFDLRVEISNKWSHATFVYARRFQDIVEELPNLRLGLDLSDKSLSDYDVSLTIDGALAYSGSFTDDGIPF